MRVVVTFEKLANRRPIPSGPDGPSKRRSPPKPKATVSIEKKEERPSLCPCGTYSGGCQQKENIHNRESHHLIIEYKSSVYHTEV
jgi:hypothetical protein